MKFPKIYIEITNRCNLHCSFCRGTVREGRVLSVSDFRRYAEEARPFTDHLYLHVMGEPLLHPELDDILTVAGDLGLRVGITTNGTLLDRRLDTLLRHRDMLYKVSISLHSFEANHLPHMTMAEYLQGATDSARTLGTAGVIVALRLWNEHKATAAEAPQNTMNDAILAHLRAEFPHEWTPNRRGERIGEGVYLEWGESFDWPATDGSVPDYGPRAHCFAMKDHIAILADGRVLPCCIDCDGVMPLGTLEENSLAEILKGPAARDFLAAKTKSCLNYPLCRHCNFS